METGPAICEAFAKIIRATEVKHLVNWPAVCKGLGTSSDPHVILGLVCKICSTSWTNAAALSLRCDVVVSKQGVELQEKRQLLMDTTASGEIKLKHSSLSGVPSGKLGGELNIRGSRFTEF